MNAGSPFGEAAKRPAGYRPSRLFVALMALVLVGVIGWLAPAILSPFGRRYPPPTRVARIEVATVYAALKAFHVTYASYPTGNLAQVSASLRGSNRQGLIFLNVPGRSLNDAGELVDAWKRPLRIILTNPAGPIVYSVGPDGRDDGGVPGSDDLIAP